jgi:hypothetical protein
MIKSIDSPNYKLTDSVEDPTNLDYNIFGFNKLRTIVNGELIQVRLEDEISNPVVIETRTYKRDSNYFVTSRDTMVQWFLEDGTIGCEKTWTKTYTPEEAIVEGEDRRKNVINEAKYTLFSAVGKQYAFHFLLGVKVEMGYYVDGYMTPLMSKIVNSPNPYMTQNIKDNLTLILTI